MVGDAVLDRADPRADPRLHAHDLARRPRRAFDRRFARMTDAPGKLPQPAPESMRGTLYDQNTTAVAKERRDVDHAHRRAARWNLGPRGRVGAVARAADGQERAAFASRVGGRADERAQLHHRLVEIARLA